MSWASLAMKEESPVAQSESKPTWPREMAVQVVWVVVLSAAIMFLLAYCDASIVGTTEGHPFIALRTR